LITWPINFILQFTSFVTGNILIIVLYKVYNAAVGVSFHSKYWSVNNSWSRSIPIFIDSKMLEVWPIEWHLFVYSLWNSYFYYLIPYINVISYVLLFSEILKRSSKANCWPANSFDFFPHTLWHHNCKIEIIQLSTYLHKRYWLVPFFFNLSGNKTVITYVIWE